MSEKAIFCWSGGKDSAYCLGKVLDEKKYDVKALLTTLNQKHKRISMHGVHQELLEKQAQSIGIPLHQVFVETPSNQEYENKMIAAFQKFHQQDISHVIFGDIFLEDLRVYREKLLQKANMKGAFPLWGQDTQSLIQDFLSNGFEAISCCIYDAKLSKEFVGRALDKVFFDELPLDVDVCGENGEYHSFCTNAPFFKEKIPISVTEKVYRPISLQTQEKTQLKQGFWFAELSLMA